jgi:hypothetical protein
VGGPQARSYDLPLSAANPAAARSNCCVAHTGRVAAKCDGEETNASVRSEPKPATERAEQANGEHGVQLVEEFRKSDKYTGQWRIAPEEREAAHR